MCCQGRAPSWRTRTKEMLLGIVLFTGLLKTHHADTSDTEEISNERIRHANSSEPH